MNPEVVQRYLAVIKRAVKFIEAELDISDGGLLEQMIQNTPVIVPPVNPAPVPQPVSLPPTPVQSTEQFKDAQEARKKHIGDLLAIDCWPEAVPAYLTEQSPSDEDQANRANAVLDWMIEDPLEGKTFLDFGCGEGWIAQTVLARGVKEAVGYDIAPDPNWNKRTGATYVSDYSSLPKGHFNVIMLYDVLDHCESPLDVMSKVRACAAPDARIYVRCHPWTSRHATHLYKQGLNRAYWHLFLTWEEIKELIKQVPMFARTEKNPLEAYHWWFSEFRIRKERPINDTVSEFFYVPSFKELLANEQQIPLPEIDAFLKRMEMQFVDYVLSLK